MKQCMLVLYFICQFAVSSLNAANHEDMAAAAGAGGDSAALLSEAMAAEAFFTEDQPGFLTRSISDNLHFSLVPITDANKESWLNFTRAVAAFFSEEESMSLLRIPASFRAAVMGAEVIENGVFNKGITRPESGDFMWMAVLSFSPLSLAKDFVLTVEEWGNIEMAVSSSTNLKAIFSVNMGIFRNPLSQYERTCDHEIVKKDGAPIPNKGISVLLHSMAAKAVAQFRVNNGAQEMKYVISSPVRVMAQILERALPAKCMGHAYNEYVENSTYNPLTRAFELNGTYRYITGNMLYRVLLWVDGCDLPNKAYYAETTPITIWRSGQTWTKVQISDPDGKVVFESEQDDETWWLWEVARKRDPLVTIPFEHLAN